MDDRAKILAVLSHIDGGNNLRDFAGTKNEKTALIARITKRRLVQWEKGRGLYRLTWTGRWQLGKGNLTRSSLFSVKIIAATCAAATVAVLGFWADASLMPVGGQTTSARLVPIARPPLLASAPSASTDIGPSYSVDNPKVFDQPSTALAIGSVESPQATDHPTTVTPAKPIELDKTPLTIEPKKKIAKSRRHKTYASHHLKYGPGSTFAATDAWQAQQHQYFNYGVRGVWSSFR